MLPCSALADITPTPRNRKGSWFNVSQTYGQQGRLKAGDGAPADRREYVRGIAEPYRMQPW
jgi:hypothetical protein